MRKLDNKMLKEKEGEQQKFDSDVVLLLLVIVAANYPRYDQ
jgi:hypothetical protein